jgi:hypothetical protein
MVRSAARTEFVASVKRSSSANLFPPYCASNSILGTAESGLIKLCTGLINQTTVPKVGDFADARSRVKICEERSDGRTRLFSVGRYGGFLASGCVRVGEVLNGRRARGEERGALEYACDCGLHRGRQRPRGKRPEERTLIVMVRLRQHRCPSPRERGGSPRTGGHPGITSSS